MTERQHKRHVRAARPARPHPNYNDEISIEQIEVIRKLADPDGRRAAKRVLLYPSVI